MTDKLKELIAKGIKLDYREIYTDDAVILRWGDDVHFIENKIRYRKNPKFNMPCLDYMEIEEIKNITEDLIKSCIEAKSVKGIHQK